MTLLVAVCCALVTTFAGATGEETVSNMYGTFWALVPPIIAITLALITKEVYSSLFIGIVAGAFFYSGGHPVEAFDTIMNSGLLGGLADVWTVGIMIFLVILGIIVALVNKAGGSAAFGRWAQKHIKTRAGAMLATFALGVLIFIDDYFNCLTVGSVMRPVTDGHNISRAKLSYLIDATAAPICMIAPISSWAAAVSSYAEGTSYSGFQLFIRAIPYNFYSLLTIVMIVAMILMKFDYGPMAQHEKNALAGDLFTTGNFTTDEMNTEGGDKGKVIDLVFPILVLIVCCVVGMIYTGGFFDGASFIDSFANSDASIGLSSGSLLALIIIIFYLLLRRLVRFKDAMDCVPKGFNAMVPAILILTLATTLKGMTGLLGADVYVAGIMEGSAKGLQMFLPAIIFVVACFLAFSTGTSWGTFGILIPIVTAVFKSDSTILIIGISACLAGAVCGDHCSPISDTTIMASAGAQCDHVNHVSTQLPYAITVAVVSFVSYIMAGFIQNIVVLPIAIVLMIATLVVIRTITRKKVG
ncbi:MAG: Na+/H+ antiporter NhaC family protein [Oscillospiraceae bacterium]|jgi:tetracycline resistance efflux pump